MKYDFQNVYSFVGDLVLVWFWSGFDLVVVCACGIWYTNMNTCAVLSLLVFSLILALRKDLLAWISGCRSQNASNKTDIKRVAPYPAAPIKGRQRYRVMMDVRKLDVDNWLTMDKNYLDEHQIRAQLLAQQKRKVLQCLPESYEACVEALEEVVDFLCSRFPAVFAQTKSGDQVTVNNKMTGEVFVFGGEKNAHIDPLEVAVRLTMEDLSILMKNQDDEYYMLVSLRPQVPGPRPPLHDILTSKGPPAQVSSP